MKISELVKILKKHGCYRKRSGGRHDIWYSPHTNKLFQIPRHGSQDTGTGLVNSIFKQAGIK